MSNLLDIGALKEHLRILDDSEDNYLQLTLDSAVRYVVNHTGLSKEEVLLREDLQRIILIVSSDFYWNRDYQTGNKYTNRLVDSILENNRINFVK